MATGLDPESVAGARGCNDVATRVFKDSLVDLTEGIQDPDKLAVELYAKNVIVRTTRDQVIQITLTRDQKNNHLLAAVECQLRVNPKAFDVFLFALRERPSLDDLCKRMEKAYRKFSAVEPPSSIVSARLPSESERICRNQSLSPISPSESEQVSFSRNMQSSTIPSCTSRFPYLDTGKMNDRQKFLLACQLFKDSTNIMSKFSDFIHYTIVSLKANPEVTVRILSARVASLGAYKPVRALKPLLRDQLDEIRKCTTIDDVFLILQEYYSFFNYGIIQRIITWFPTPDDERRVEEYTEDFKVYCKRRIFECPPDSFGYICEGKSTLVVKTEDTWDPHEKIQGKVLDWVLQLQSTLAEILQVETETLYLCRIDKGCVELLFTVPSFVEEDIFPLCVEQERSLTTIEVVKLTCGRYTFPSKEQNSRNTQPIRQEVVSPSSPISQKAIMSQDKERLNVLVRDLCNEKVHVAVLYSRKSGQHHQKAREIRDHVISKRIRVSLIDFEDNWLQCAKTESVTHHIFVGIPVLKRATKSVSLGPTPEEKYTESGQIKLSQVVVIQPNMPATKAEILQGHYLERFLQLDYKEDSTWLAEAALAMFAGQSPKACDKDFAYWSAEPKLVDVWRTKRASLGLSIMTREVAKDSQFERIVLIKGFNDECSSDLRKRVGKYTHIQSVNGRFLDGLSTNNVTEIFQSLKNPHVQLIVRFIHPIKSRPDTISLESLPHRSSTHIPKRRSSKTNGDTQVLPTPLFILGDNSQLQKRLFDLLSSDNPVSDSHSLCSPAVESSLSPNIAGSPHPAAASPISSDGNPLLSPNSKEDVLTPLHDVQRGLAVKMRRGSCRELSESDKCIERAEVHVNKFEVETSSLPNLAKHDATTPLQSRPQYGRQFSTRPQIAKQQFILHMLKKDVDRQFAHIFLKSSGIYLVVIGLDDVLGDPLIQYENLFYWLRLIQTHIRPDELKRVIVVGMYRKSEVQRCDLILKCVQHLSTAIRDQMKQNFCLPTEEKGFVFMFDLDDAQTDLQYLCASIKSLMDIHIDQAWFYFRDYFESVFLPFDSFRKVCTQLSQVGKHKVAEPSKNIRKVIGSPLPNKSFETVAAYATGCIDSKGDSLLRPSFIPDLLTTFTEPMSHHDYQIHMVLPGFLRHLPIVNSPLLSARMAQLGAPERKEQELIFEWLKRLEFAYSIGKIGGRGEEKFFVPFLAAASQSDNASYNWDPDLEAQFDDCPVVLYTQLHIPATEHFYHRLIASLLSDAVKSSQHQKPCYIKLGCEAAILPLQSEDRDSPNTLSQVLLKYHAVQNIIEFRAREPKSLLLLKAVKAKLSDTFTNSKYCSMSDFKGAFSFHIPAEEFEQTLREGPIWKLGNVGVGSADDADAIFDHDRPEDVLLKTKLLTQPGHTRNPELRAWASLDPQMKELSSDLYLYLQRKLSTNDRYWTLVGSKLNLLSTDDIDYYRRNPETGGNGGIVLQKWMDSRLTFKDLVSALKSQDVGLDEAATRVEKYFVGH